MTKCKLENGTVLGDREHHLKKRSLWSKVFSKNAVDNGELVTSNYQGFDENANVEKLLEHLKIASRAPREESQKTPHTFPKAVPVIKNNKANNGELVTSNYQGFDENTNLEKLLEHLRIASSRVESCY
ncbi:hypothetical protein PtA15_12A473 [Puccinia triticina]|uniref:Uncharacterized protein n=1 Tax=Puccinia triticina TaxID=208348 RepID=A0ABY7CZZ9_9BASI|nr:uncharacterized protein PtA15_12A473 [Puccinia triticina]WAQ90483.1 hypothetical protein PtA15_12A473 [Puccinia triticina]